MLRTHGPVVDPYVVDHAREDEVVFLKTKQQPRPQLIYYAHRNLQVVNTVEEAQDWLRRHPQRIGNGIVFSNLSPVEFDRIQVRQDEVATFQTMK